MFNHRSGYIADSFDPRDVWEDELFAGEVEIPDEYKVEGLTYQRQGAYPYCVSFATSTLAEWKYKQLHGHEFSFSQPHLFYTAGGNEQGSSARQNLNVMRDIGGINYELFPMPENLVKKPSDWLEQGRKKAKGIATGGAKKIPGFMRVIASERLLKKAILQHGPLIVGVWVSKSDGYYTGDGKRHKDDDNHVILLAGWTKTHWVIFDSLSWVESNKGYGTLSNEYTFRFAYAMEALPENWKQLRDEARKAPQGALEHYGQQRVWQNEKDAERAILEAFQTLANKEVFDAASRFWTIYINAVAYGGYTTTDVVNDCYKWRRTGLHEFDFNEETRDQWVERVKGLK